MSWSVYVQVREGKAEVDKTYGDLEDGTYIVSGHESEGNDSLSVSRQREHRAEHIEHRGETPGVH